MDFSLRKAIGGALLVGGTAIGAGMLALPVVTGMGGFFPAIVIFIICWLFSACTGLLLLEVCLWMPNDANIISMAHHLLGPIGKISAWILYLFLFYCLTIAYAAGGGSFIVELFGGKIPHSIGVILFTAIFGTFVYLGTRAVDRINFLLMIGLGVSYLVFVILGVGEVKVEFLKRMQWFPAIMALPVMFTSFSTFALTTSFLGVTLGLMDFLSDGLQLPKVGWKKILLCMIVYIPPVIIAIINPNIFLRALGYAGGIGCALLLGLLPIIMVWVGRYQKEYSDLNRQLPGGKGILTLLSIFVIFELLIELTKELIR